MRTLTISNRHRSLAVAFLVATLAVVGALTLVPGPPTPTAAGVSCFFCGSRDLADAILNVLLFVPVGIGLVSVGVPWRRAILIGAVLSVAIEATQVFLPGRDASAEDVFTNTLGTALGVALVTSAANWLRPSTRAAARLAASAALIAAVTFAASGYLLRPSLPDSVYYGQWTPVQGHLEPYGGRVLSATIGPYETHSWRLDNSEEVRAALAEGARVEILGIAGSPLSRLGSIFSVMDDTQREILLVGVDRDELVLRFRSRAADLHLDQPELRFTNAIARATPGDTLRISTWRVPDGRCVDTGSGAHCALGFTLGDGWSLLAYPEHLPDPLRGMLGPLWIAMWLVPLGFWFRRRPEALAGVVLIAMALAAPLMPGGLLPTTMLEWVGGLVGFGLGVWLRSWVVGLGAQRAERGARSAERRAQSAER